MVEIPLRQTATTITLGGLTMKRNTRDDIGVSL